MPCSSRNVSSNTSPNVPGRTSTSIDVVSTPTMPSNAVRSSSTPPYAGTLAPHTPLRPAAAVSGTCASLHDAHDRCDLVGVVRADDERRARRNLRVERPDHRERPPVAARFRDRGGRRRRARRRSPASVGAQLVVDVDALRPGSGREPRPRRTRSAASAPLGWCARRPRLRVRRAVATVRRARSRAGRPRRAPRRSMRRSAATWAACSPSSQPSSAAMSAATSSAAAADASRARSRARVRRDSTSSTVRAISARTAYTTSARVYGKPSISGSRECGIGLFERERPSRPSEP